VLRNLNDFYQQVIITSNKRRSIMKTLVRSTVLSLGLVLAMLGQARADGLYFSSLGGPVTVGSTFSINLLGNFTELAGGVVDLGYNDNLIQIDLVTVDASWNFLTCSEDPSRCGSQTVTGTNSVWSSIGFDTLGLPMSGNAISIATISLTALAAGNPELHVLGSSETFDSIQLLTPTLGTAGITVAAPAAVPVPPAVWLFASGLLGLVGVARRKG